MNETPREALAEGLRLIAYAVDRAERDAAKFADVISNRPTYTTNREARINLATARTFVSGLMTHGATIAGYGETMKGLLDQVETAIGAAGDATKGQS